MLSYEKISVSVMGKERHNVLEYEKDVHLLSIKVFTTTIKNIKNF